MARDARAAGVRPLVAALLIAAVTALHPASGSRVRAPHRPMLAVPSSRRALVALSAEVEGPEPGTQGGGSETATASAVEQLPPGSSWTEKRLRAQRLALLAERAALQAEQFELEAEQLRLVTALKRGTPVEEKPRPRPASAQPPSPALSTEPAGGAAAATTDKKSIPEANPNETSQAGFGGLRFPSPKGLNDTSLTEPPVAGPLASALRSMGGGKTVTAEDLQLSEEQVKAVLASVLDPSCGFYVTDVEQSPVGTVFRGNLRADAAKLYAKMQASLDATPSLSGTQLLLLMDPLPLSLQQMQEGAEKRPVVLAVSPDLEPMRQSLPEYGLVALSGALAGLTTVGYSLSSYILTNNGAIIEQLNAGDTGPIDLAFPIAAGIGAIQLLHEAAHFVAGQLRGVRTALPIALPSLQLGSYGCVTRLLNFPPSRTALFDVALAGPAAALFISFTAYIIGLALSAGLPPPAAPDPAAVAAAAAATANGIPASALVGATVYPVVPTALLQSSLLLGGLAHLLLPSLSGDAATALTTQLHPLAVVGFTSFLCNALQLLPVGQLDGGRVSAAVFGPAGASLVSGLALLALGLSTLVAGDDPVVLFFGLFVIFFQRQPELPCANELTPVDDVRRAAAAAALLLVALTLLPYPITPGAGMDGFPFV